MRAFFSGLIGAFAIALIASYVLDAFQKGSDVANTTSGARVDYAKDGIGGSNNAH